MDVDVTSIKILATGEDERVADVVTRLIAALEPDATVIGAGNAAKLDALPPHSCIGENANAFLGGFRLWEKNVALPQAGARSKQQG